MAYADYLRLEGWCSIVLGAALAAVAAPGLERSDAWALVLVPATVVMLAVVGRRAGAPLRRPGTWLTERPLRGAEPGRPAIDPSRRLVAETAVWIVAVGAWVLLAGESHGLVFATGLASAVFGAVQAFAARSRVRAEEARRGVRFCVARRPGIGTPRLAVRD